MTDSLLKLVGHPEHCVNSERVCYCPNLYKPDKWYAYARNCIGPRYSKVYFWPKMYVRV